MRWSLGSKNGSSYPGAFAIYTFLMLVRAATGWATKNAKQNK